MSRRNLPPLQVGTAYEATDFEKFEYFGSKLTGSEAILRLHLKNKTTIDLPASDAELKNLLIVLCEAFPKDASEHLISRNWASPVVQFPLVVRAPSATMDNPALQGAATPETLQLQLDTQSGQSLMVPLNPAAARNVALACSAWLHERGYSLETGLPELGNQSEPLN